MNHWAEGKKIELSEEVMIAQFLEKVSSEIRSKWTKSEMDVRSVELVRFKCKLHMDWELTSLLKEIEMFC